MSSEQKTYVLVVAVGRVVVVREDLRMRRDVDNGRIRASGADGRRPCAEVVRASDGDAAGDIRVRV